MIQCMGIHSFLLALISLQSLNLTNFHWNQRMGKARLSVSRNNVVDFCKDAISFNGGLSVCMGHSSLVCIDLLYTWLCFDIQFENWSTFQVEKIGRDFFAFDFAILMKTYPASSQKRPLSLNWHSHGVLHYM